MDLEQQVSNRKLSEMLRDLGVKQESLFAWICGELDTSEERESRSFFVKDDWASAFTVAELVQILNSLVVAKSDIHVALRDINADYLAKSIISIYEKYKS